MRLPLLVKGSISCEPPTVLIPKGKWMVESDETSSIIALHHSGVEASIKNGDVVEFVEDIALKLKVIQKGTENNLTVYLKKVA